MNAFPAISNSAGSPSTHYRTSATRSKSGAEGSDFSDQLAESSTPKTQSEEEAKPTDFSHMSCRELRTWINEQLRSGKMTFDESTSYVSLTLNGMPVNGDMNSYQDKTQDYVAVVERGIEGAKWRNDDAELARLQAMLAKMREASAKADTQSRQNKAQSTHTDSKASSSLPDFTNITPRELQSWYRNQPSSEKADDDVFLNYATLALGGMPVDGDQESFLNTPQNYLANLRDGIAGARWMNDEKKATDLERIMERIQEKKA